MRTRPEGEAQGLLQKLRSGVQVSDILRQVHDGDLLLQLALVPETKFRYEFPLVHDMPASLLQPDNPYVTSAVYEWTSGQEPGVDDGTLATSTPPTDQQACYLYPFHAAHVVEPLLQAVVPSRWTSVSSDNKLMLDIFQHYFLDQHASWDFFPKDMFLTDMAAGRPRFCSSLLVNAVLALGSVSATSGVAQVRSARCADQMRSSVPTSLRTAPNSGIRRPWPISFLRKRGAYGRWRPIEHR
jgi:hypothetical protein